MWKYVNGKLIHTTTSSRIIFRTNISKSILESLKVLLIENNTHVNYLIENGLKKVLEQEIISFNKFTRPKIVFNIKQHMIMNY